MKLNHEEREIYKSEMEMKKRAESIRDSTSSAIVLKRAKERIETADAFLNYLNLKYPEGYVL
jgi:hypothetical protein